jgi:hypothetical protein
MPTFAPGTQYYVPVTLTNNAASNTQSGLQISITVNSTSYSSHLASNLANVNWQDGNGNILTSWLESGETSSSTTTVYWVNLGSNIIPGEAGTLIIYYCLYNTGSQIINGTDTGAEPNYTGTYGQYDNGASIFSFYDNFPGTSLNPRWIIAGGPTISVDNGLTLNGSGSGSNGIYASYNSSGNDVLEVHEKILFNPQSLNTAFMLGTSLNSQSQPNSGYFADRWGNQSGTGAVIGYMSSGNLITLASESSTYASLGTLYTHSLVFVTGYNIRLQINYGTTVDIGTAEATYASTDHIYIAVYASSSFFIQWARDRLAPPQNTMPAVSFGSLTPNTGVASGSGSIQVTASLNDAFGSGLIQALASLDNAALSGLGTVLGNATASFVPTIYTLTGNDSFETIWMMVDTSGTGGTFQTTAISNFEGATFSFVAYRFPAGTYNISNNLGELDSSGTLTLSLPSGNNYYIYGGASGNSPITTSIANVNADGTTGSGGSVIGNDTADSASITGTAADFVMGGIAVTRTDSAFVPPTIQSNVIINSPVVTQNFTYTANSGEIVVLVVAVGWYGATITNAPIIGGFGTITSTATTVVGISGGGTIEGSAEELFSQIAAGTGAIAATQTNIVAELVTGSGSIGAVESNFFNNAATGFGQIGSSMTFDFNSGIALNNVFVKTTKYEITKKVKYRIYNLPHSDLDSFLFMGAYNRVYDLDIYTIMPTGETETVLAILQQPKIILQDVEGDTHTIAVTEISVEVRAEMPQVAVLHIEAIDFETIVTAVMNWQVFRAESIGLVPVDHAQVIIGSTSLFTDVTGSAGPFPITDGPSGIAFTLTVVDTSNILQVGSTVILQGVTKICDNFGQVHYYISPSGTVF